MSVRQNGNKFMADFMSNGVRHRQQFATTEEATAWEAELKKRIRLGMPYQELIDAKGGKMTIDELLAKTFVRFWEDTANESTQLGNIRLINEFFGATLPVDKLNTLALDDFINAMEKKKLAPSTINGRLATISKALTYAQDRGYINTRPKIERKKVSNQRLRFFTEEEEYEMLEALRADGRDDFAYFIEWSIDTGMRPIESRNVPQSSLREDDELGYLIDLRKTKNAYPRTIPLTKRAHSAFAALSSEEFMPFAQFTESNIRKHWRFVREVMNDIDPEFVFYLTRHTCASRLVQRNVPLHVVKEWMGHRTYEMTLRYAKLTPRNFLDAKVALEQAL
jgi:integrase